MADGCIYLLELPFGLGEVPRLRCSTGERFGDREIIIELLFSFSGDGDEPPPVAEFLRDGVRRMVASKCLKLIESKQVIQFVILFSLFWLIHD